MANVGEVVVSIKADTRHFMTGISAVNKRLTEMSVLSNTMGERLAKSTLRVDKNLARVGATGKKATDSLGKGVQQSDHFVRALNTKFNQMYRTLFNIKTIALVAFGGLVKMTGEAAGSQAQLTAALETMTGEGEKMYSSLTRWALGVNVNTEDAIEMYKRLHATGLRPNIDDMERLLDLTNAFGGGTAIFHRVTKLFGDIAAKGRLMGQEVRQATEIGIPIEQLMIDAGIMSEAMRGNMAKAGVNAKDTFKVVFKWIDENFGGLTKRMMQEWNGLVERFRDTSRLMSMSIGKIATVPVFKKFVEQFEKAVSPEKIGATTEALLQVGIAFKTVFEALLNSLVIVVKAFVSFTSYINSLSGFVAFFEGLYLSIKTVLTPFIYLIKLTLWFVQLISEIDTPMMKFMGGVAGLVVAFKTLNGFIASATTAFAFFNTVVLLNPYTRLIAGFIAMAVVLSKINDKTTTLGHAFKLTILKIQKAWYSLLAMLSSAPLVAAKVLGFDVDTSSLSSYLEKIHNINNEIDILNKNKKERDSSNLFGSGDPSIDKMREDIKNILNPEMHKNLFGEGVNATIGGGALGGEGAEKAASAYTKAKKAIEDMNHSVRMEIDGNAKLLPQMKAISDLTEQFAENKQILTEGQIKNIENLYAENRLLERQKEVIKPYNDLVDSMSNGWKNWGDLVLKSLEDAGDKFADFCLTGKFKFKDFANSVISDMMRMMVRSQITTPLATIIGTGFSAAMGGLFGGGDSFTGPSAPVTPVTVTDLAPATKPFAGGGVVNEPVYGFGLNSGRSYSFAEHGSEEVIPHGSSAKGGVTSVRVELVNKSGTPLKTTQSQTRFNGQEAIVSVMIDAIDRNYMGTRDAIRGVK